jgi:hypothetical protein
MKIFKCKEWLSIQDAVKYLSLLLEDEITESDLLRLVLDKQLRLSVRIASPFGVFVRSAQNPPRKEAEDKFIEGGVYDLVMEGLERRDVVSRYRELTGIDENKFIVNRIAGFDRAGFYCSGVFVKDSGGNEFVLLDSGVSIGDSGGNEPDRKLFPSQKFPDGSTLVVRTAALREFADSILTPKKQDRPLAATERHTLLRIIGGLVISAYRSDIHANRISNVKEIADDLARVGVSVTEKTLSEKIKAAAELIEKPK